MSSVSTEARVSADGTIGAGGHHPGGAGHATAMHISRVGRQKTSTRRAGSSGSSSSGSSSGSSRSGKKPVVSKQSRSSSRSSHSSNSSHSAGRKTIAAKHTAPTLGGNHPHALRARQQWSTRTTHSLRRAEKRAYNWAKNYEHYVTVLGKRRPYAALAYSRLRRGMMGGEALFYERSEERRVGKECRL